MRLILSLCLALLVWPAFAQQAAQVLEENRALVEKPSRQTIGPVIDALVTSGDPMAARILTAFESRQLGTRDEDGAFVIIDGDTLTGATVTGKASAIRPNSGVRGGVAAALVQFQPGDPARRGDALAAIARNPDASYLEPLREALAQAPDPHMARLERLLTLRFDPDPAARVAAIKSFSGDMGLDVRGAEPPGRHNPHGQRDRQHHPRADPAARRSLYRAGNVGHRPPPPRPRPRSMQHLPPPPLPMCIPSLTQPSPMPRRAFWTGSP